MIKTILLSLGVLLSIPAATVAQQKSSLLWKITGKGHERPSYLYGTIHITDKRVFNFDDSVYAAIQKTEGLALELDMNEALAYYLENYQLNKDQGKKLTDILDKKMLSKLEGKLKKKFDKDIDDITTDDLAMEKNRWMQDYIQKGGMPTFVDGYLYTLAKKQGKWLGGIEDAADQVSLLESSDVMLMTVDEKTFGLEDLVNLYCKQDMDSIQKLLEHMDSSARDRFLTRRNLKMTQRMDSLMNYRSMFFAVGTLHLPGKDGVIELLRQRGFSVEPVLCSKKTHADKYVVAEVPVAWRNVTNKGEEYVVSMPGEPATMNLYGLQEMKLLFDLSNMAAYCITTSYDRVDSADRQQRAKAIAEQYFGHGKIRSERQFLKDGVPGWSFEGNRDNIVARIHIFYRNNIFYLQWVYGFKKEVLHTPAADQFFKSLQFLEPTVSGDHDYIFSDSTWGFSLITPSRLERNEQLRKQAGQDPSWTYDFFSAADQKLSAYIMISARQTTAGSYVADDSSHFADIRQAMEQKGAFEFKDTMLFSYRALKGTGTINNFDVNFLSYIRGNKSVTVTVVAPPSSSASPALRKVFSSLRVLPYKAATYYRATDSSDRFTALTPQPFFYVTSPASGRKHTVIFDSLSATSYYVIADTLNPYTWTADKQEFLGKKLASIVDDPDTVLAEYATMNDNDEGREIIIQNKNKGTFYRVRMLLHGDRMFTLSATADREALTCTNADQFYSTFQAKGTTDFSITKNKAKLLIDALQSEDSVRQQQAYEALPSATFTTRETGLLRNALFVRYPSHLSYDETYINRQIGDQLAKLDHAGLLNWIKKQYDKLNTENSWQRSVALYTLPKIKSKESYAAITEMLPQATPISERDFYFMDSMMDSLEVLSGIYPQLSSLITDSTCGLIAVVLISKLYDSGYIEQQDLKRLEAGLIQLTQRHESIISSDSDASYGYGKLIHLLEQCKTENANLALRKFLNAADLYYKNQTALILLDLQQTIPEEVWKALAENKRMRSALYDDLKERNKLDLFPGDQLTAQKLAESELYNNLWEYFDTDPNIEFLREKTAKVTDTNYRFYLFRITDAADTAQSHLAFVGGYDPEGKNLRPSPYILSVCWSEDYDREKEDEQFDKYLEAYYEEAAEEE